MVQGSTFFQEELDSLPVDLVQTSDKHSLAFLSFFKISHLLPQFESKTVTYHPSHRRCKVSSS
jgi:hypothetical protein